MVCSWRRNRAPHVASKCLQWIIDVLAMSFLNKKLAKSRKPLENVQANQESNFEDEGILLGFLISGLKVSIQCGPV